MLHNSCPLCHSSISSVFYNTEFPILRCSYCGHYYTKVNPNIDFNELYSKGDYDEFDSRDTIFEKIIDFENTRILKRINKFTKQKKILDFGSGKGKFLKIAKKRKWECDGLETAKIRAEYARKNYDVLVFDEEYITGMIKAAPFDIITFFHVLEHLPNAKNLLQNILENNLSVGGLVVIEVPNINSLQSKIAGKNWLHLDVPRHINHFSKDNLEKMLNDLGLQTKKIEYFHFIHGLTGMLSSLFGLFGYKKNLMSEMKYRKTFKLLISIIIFSPFALLLELIASVFERGAVLRIYVSKK